MRKVLYISVTIILLMVTLTFPVYAGHGYGLASTDIQTNKKKDEDQKRKDTETREIKENYTNRTIDTHISTELKNQHKVKYNEEQRQKNAIEKKVEDSQETKESKIINRPNTPTSSISKNKSNNKYIIQDGDNLWNIAQRFGTTVDVIKNINKLKNDIVIPGRQLNTMYTVEDGENLWEIAQKSHTTVDIIKSLNELKNDIVIPGQQLKVFRN